MAFACARPRSRIAGWSLCILAGILVLPTGLVHGGSHPALNASSPTTTSSPPSLAHPDPFEGDSSPGLAHYRLVSTPLAGSGCAAGGSQYGWLAYDHADRSVWATVQPDCVAIVSNGSVVGGVAVGSTPFGVAVDPVRDLVFVTNTGSGNVTVISDITDQVVGSIAVGAEPAGIAYGAGEMFVANSGSNNVSVINDSTMSVVATVAVGGGPVGVAVDAIDGRVYVANNASDSVTVIGESNGTVLDSLPTGATPRGVAWDWGNNRIFVSNQGSNNVTVIDAAADIELPSIPAIPPGNGGPIQLDGMTYDNLSGAIWIGAGWAYAMELNASSLTVVGYISVDPSGMAYDFDQDRICGSDTANVTLACFQRGTVQPTEPLWFNETGLPAFTSWSVVIHSGGADFPVSGSTASLQYATVRYSFGTFAYTISPAAGLQPSPSSGNITITSGPNVVVVTFGPGPPQYPVNFVATGLPSNDGWTVVMAGSAQTSTAPTISFTEPNGSYAFSVSGPSGLRIAPGNGTLTVAGSAVVVNITFSGPPSYLVLFLAVGLPAGTLWSLNVDGTVWATAVDNLTLNLSVGWHAFQVPSLPGFQPVPMSGTLFVGSSGILVEILWIATYTATFTETGLPSGALWFVSINGSVYNSTSAEINVSEPNGTYTYVPSGPIGTTPVFATGTFIVAGAPVPVNVPFLTSPLPLSANIAFSFEGEFCGTDGTVYNQVLLIANISGGQPPYVASWSFPGGTAEGVVVNATITWSAILTPVTLTVVDSTGATVRATAFIGMDTIVCSPSSPTVFPPSGLAGSPATLALVGLAVAAVPGAIVLWIGIRRSREPPMNG